MKISIVKEDGSKVYTCYAIDRDTKSMKKITEGSTIEKVAKKLSLWAKGQGV
jgi:hypothetical protein